MRVGIGPVGSGTENLARQVIARLAELDLKVSTQPIAEQIDMLVRGDLDLGAMVIERDAAQIAEAVRDRKLQVLDFAGADCGREQAAFRAAGHHPRRPLRPGAGGCRRPTSA
jgi:hypothetical protein